MGNLAKTIMILLSTTALAACGGAGSSPGAVSDCVNGACGTGGGGTGGGTGGGGTGGGGTGGGGTGGGGGGTYPTLASLTGDQVFTASTGEIVLKDTARQDRVDYRGFGENVEYTAATNTYTLDGIGQEFTDFTTDPSAIRRITVNDAAGELAYSRMSRWDHGDTAGRVGFVTYGLTTRDEDTPSGSISYRQVGFHGSAFRQENGQEAQYDLKNSTLDLKYDFTTFSLDMLMTLIGTPMAGGADQTLGLFTEKDNTVAGGRNNIDGFVVKQGTDTIMGAFSLRFYGPGADEYGLAFGMNATNELKAAGAAAGRRR